MDPYIGQVLDSRYELLERIGVGGMAIVYKARDNRLNRLVAVKILRTDLAQDADFRRRFNAESQAVAKLANPHIVSVYDVSRGGDVEYIVMELIDGITLKQYMEQRGELNWRETLHFIIQIMRALAHAHSRGVVHRDIKPQNIMVLRDGSVKVADFGIAFLENSAQTLTQQALGSVHYISPEQAKGERADARSDIYSAGVVLYEMLTGTLPFEGESAVAVALQHLSSVPPMPRTLRPEIPPQLELICMKAMAQDLSRRYASAEEMIRDLELFRRDPSMNLDFQISDVRAAKADEPTRPLGHALSDSGGRKQKGEASGDPVQTVLIALAGVLALILVVVVYRGIQSSFHTPAASGPAVEEPHLVENLVGYTVAEAQQLDGVKGIFTVRQAGLENSDEYPRGVILRQDPAAFNYRKGTGLEILVWVSSGEETGVMPDVVNQTLSVAERLTLKELTERFDLTIEASEEDRAFDDAIPAGYIISSTPKKGETIHRGDVIRLVISKGRQTWALYSFVSMNYFTEVNQVNQQLSAQNMSLGSITQQYSDAPFGTILSQDPAPSTQVTEGTKINFVVSKGPEPPAPDLTLEVIIPLPQDREQAYMEILRDGKPLESGHVDCTAGSFSFKITGRGETELTVYLDGEECFHENVTLIEGRRSVTLRYLEPHHELEEADSSGAGTSGTGTAGAGTSGTGAADPEGSGTETDGTGDGDPGVTAGTGASGNDGGDSGSAQPVGEPGTGPDQLSGSGEELMSAQGRDGSKIVFGSGEAGSMPGGAETIPGESGFLPGEAPEIVTIGEEGERTLIRDV